MGRMRGTHIRWVESAKAYGVCIVLHIVTARDIDLVDLEEYDIYPFFSTNIFQITYNKRSNDNEYA